MSVLVLVVDDEPALREVLSLRIAEPKATAERFAEATMRQIAVKAGVLSPETADQAVQTATTTIDGLASHGYDLDRWLGTSGMELTWPGA